MNPAERPHSALKKELLIEFEALLASNDEGKTITDYSEAQIVFSQGDPANAVFYILNGKIKRTALSETGREAIIAVLGPSEFLGEGCLSGQTVQMSTATAMTRSRIVRCSKKAILQTLRQTPKFSEFFIAHLVSRAVRMEADLVDQLFNSSEKRLARVLLLLANFGKESKPEVVIPKVSQEMLAEMVGTTRPRINFFMNKFRKLGFIEYHDDLHVHSSLLNVFLFDSEHHTAGRSSLLTKRASAAPKK